MSAEKQHAPQEPHEPQHHHEDKPKEPWKKGPPGGYDPTPVPHAPPGYTVRITFHRATSLPIADLSTLSSDPYIHAELKTSLQPRHKEDPLLRFRSHTVWRSTTPEWNEDWILHHVPGDGFRLKVRLYDEDSSDTDDRLGNVHVNIGPIDEKWEGVHDQPFEIKKRAGSKRAYLLRAVTVCVGRAEHMSGTMHLSIEVLGRSPGSEGGRAYTVGRNYWCKHYSPLLGRITGSKEPDDAEYHGAMNKDDFERTGQPNTSISATAAEGSRSGAKQPDLDPSELRRIGTASKLPKSPDPADQSNLLDVALAKEQEHKRKKSQKQRSQRYNFQANQIQLQGPTPPELYHRYVEFRPFIKSLFTKTGIRGQILARALHHQHNVVYNFNRDTRYGVYDEPCHDMTKKFLELCHWAEAGRIFTYVLTLDALLRFTETGKEFGIDLLSKHTMHSDASIYVAFSGEFFIRRLEHPYHPDQDQSRHQSTAEGSHPPVEHDEAEPNNDAPTDPAYYELVIDNDSGTYRPNAKLLPLLRKFLMTNFPGLKVATIDCQKDADLMNRLKSKQRDRKKTAQGNHPVVFTQLGSRSGSISSDDEEHLDDLVRQREAEEAARQGGEPDTVQTHKLGEAVAPLVGNHPHIRHGLGEKPAPAGV